MNARQIILRNREINTNSEVSDKNLFKGITTRKRGALKACLPTNKENEVKAKCLENVDFQETVKEFEVIPMEISFRTDNENDLLSLDYMIKNPFVWPQAPEIEDFVKRENFRNMFIHRRESIRGHYKPLSQSGVPIWFPLKTSVPDEFMHIEYLANINDYLMDSEFHYEAVGRNFLDGSTYIGSRQRYIFVDWIVLYHNKLGMGAETLQLTIAIMDRFIKIHKKDLKIDDMLVFGMVALFMASKVEEVWPPTLKEIIEEFHLGYEADACRDFELKILTTLNFKLSIPLPISFIRYYNVIIEANEISHYLSRYFCELSLQDYEASGHSINLIGASCVFLAQVINQKTRSNFSEVWCEKLQAASGLLYNDFKYLVRNLCIVVSKQPARSNYRAITKKYNCTKFKEVPSLSLSSEGFSSILQFFKNESTKH